MKVGKRTNRRKVDTSANNFKITVSNFGISNTNNQAENLELHEELLDFEPDDEPTCNDSEEEQNHFTNSYNKYSFSRSNLSTDEFETFSSVSHENSVHNSMNQSNDHMSTASKTAISEYSNVSHKADLLPYHTYLDTAEDERKKDYLHFVPPLITGQVMMDSSSDSDSGNSFEHDDMEEVDDDYVDCSVSDYNIDSDEENGLLELYENGTEENGTEEIDNIDVWNGSEHSETSISHKDENLVQKPMFCDKNFRTSGYNIIIRTNLNDKKFILQRDSWKKTTTRLKAIDKRWQLRPKPFHHIKLFLEDIGFIPLSSGLGKSINFSCSETMSTASSSSISSCNTLNSMQPEKKRKCEQVEEYLSQISAFKVPLPPIKRPPSRPKRAGSTSSNETISSYIQRPVQECREDDVISISASSIGYLDTDHEEGVKEEQMSDYQDLISDKDSICTNVSGYWLSSQVPSSTPSLNFIPPLNTSSNSKSPVVTSSQPIPSLLTCRATWPLESEPNVGRNPAALGVTNRVIFMDVPRFFAGICYHYFFNGRCVKANCKLPHFVRESIFLNKCKELKSPEELRKLFNYSIQFHSLFGKMYPIFLKAFAHFQMRNDLINCIFLFLKKENIDFKRALTAIIESLENTGLTFLQTIENILFNVGILQFPVLANTLLDILTARGDISNNWEVIKRICKAMNFIAPEFFERILCNLLIIETPNSKVLSIDIYNTVVKNGITDLSSVEPRLLRTIKTSAELDEKLLNNFIDENLSIERERYEKSQNVNYTPALNYEETTSSDADDRLNYVDPSYSTRRSNREEKRSSVSPGTSRSSCDLETGGNNSDVYSFRGGIHDPYIPQPITKNRENIPSTIRSPKSNGIPSMSKTTQLYSPMENRVIPHSATDTTSATPEYGGYPDQPIFGKFKFNKGFVFNKWLHHLLPLNCDQVSMNESDIIELNKCISNCNGSGFLRILDLYKSPSTIQHFVTMCVAEIKTCKNPCNDFLDLLENIGTIEPNFRTKTLYKGVFEVITFNMLLVFERKCQWEDAKRLVEVFNDWDSLISSKQFGLKQLTPMGRYILLAKLFTQSNAFYYAYEILQSPDLNLLDSPKNWPLFRMDKIDLESRNAVLVDFFKNAYKSNIEVICDMFRKVFQFGNIYQFDAYSYFNPMLEHLINHEKTLLLKHFYSDIDIFHKQMERNIFRAFTIVLESNLLLDDRLRLYEYGCKKGIYVQFTGREQTMVLKTNMPNNEIKLIFQYYFNALSRLAYYEVNHNLNIEIKLPDGIVRSPRVLHSCIRSIDELNMSIKTILHDYFLLQVISPEKETNTILQVPKEELRKKIKY